MNTILSISLAALALLSPSTMLRAQHTGVQIVGLNRCSEADRDILAKLLRKAQADVEVSFLPFEFTFQGLFPKAGKDQTPESLLQATSSRAFGPAQRLVEQYFAPSNEATFKLTMTVCLHFYHKTSKYPGTSFRWNAFDDGKGDRYKPTPAEKKADAAFREQYLMRVRSTGLWIQRARQWSIENQVQDKLDFVVIPDLEDDGASKENYLEACRAIRAELNSLGVENPHLRRSSLNENAFRADRQPLEVHGNFCAGADRFLKKGDVYSNDGTVFDFANDSGLREFKSKQAGPALDAGISVLVWMPEFNLPNDAKLPMAEYSKTHPSKRPILKPFQGALDSANSKAVATILKMRPRA